MKNMKASILLISHCFAPQNKIGAVRPTKLAKYLSRMGYAVTVLCGDNLSQVSDPLLARDLELLTDVHVVRERSFLRWWKQRGQTAAESLKTAQGKPASGKARPIRNALYLYLADRADKAFDRACMRELQALGKTFDVVLSTYGPLSVHTVARKAKQRKIAKRWIADFRDEASVPFHWQKLRLKRYDRMVQRHADVITSVSKGYLRVMGLETQGQVIYNGFDPEDIGSFSAPEKRKDKLTFVHCGQMYGLQRDLSPFFRVLAALIAQGEIDEHQVSLVYAGGDTRGFVLQATEAGLENCLEGHQFMPRDESLKLQKSSHVLLLPAWNLQNRQGNIPGKLLEYMMLEMPVIGCVSGDVPGSEVADIIRETNIGICYEQSNNDTDSPLLMDYVRNLISAFMSGAPMPYSPETEAVNGFTCKGMARKMANIIEEWM